MDVLNSDDVVDNGFRWNWRGRKKEEERSIRLNVRIFFYGFCVLEGFVFFYAKLFDFNCFFVF
jgi:hypothetical protein